MKLMYSLLLGLLLLLLKLINAQILSEEINSIAHIHSPRIALYLRDLEEQRYCVIPQVLSTAETKALYQRVWHEFIEKAWPNCRMEDITRLISI